MEDTMILNYLSETNSISIENNKGPSMDLWGNPQFNSVLTQYFCTTTDKRLGYTNIISIIPFVDVDTSGGCIGFFPITLECPKVLKSKPIENPYM